MSMIVSTRVGQVKQSKRTDLLKRNGRHCNRLLSNNRNSIKSLFPHSICMCLLSSTTPSLSQNVQYIPFSFFFFFYQFFVLRFQIWSLLNNIQTVMTYCHSRFSQEKLTSSTCSSFIIILHSFCDIQVSQQNLWPFSLVDICRTIKFRQIQHRHRIVLFTFVCRLNVVHCPEQIVSAVTQSVKVVRHDIWTTKYGIVIVQS